MTDTMYLAVLLAAMLVTGACSGFLAGLLGVGGGIVVVPILFTVFDVFGVDPAVRMQVAVGTSLATIIPTSISSARSHWRKGSVDRRLLARLAPTVLAGVFLGTWLGSFVSGHVMMLVFAIAAILVGINLALGKYALVLGDKLPGTVGISAIGGLIGAVSSMMGIGGGTLTVPILSLFRFPILNAVGTASALGLIISIPGTLGYTLAGIGNPHLPPFQIGFVNWVGFLIIAPVSIFFAPWGAKTAYNISKTTLSRAFACFLFVTASKMLWSLFGH